MGMHTTKGHAPAEPEDDAGLEADMQEYRRKGGPDGGAAAKRQEGKIARRAAVHDERLNKARPASSPNDPASSPNDKE